MKKRAPAPKGNLPDLPWTIRLSDGRTVFVEVPGEWLARDPRTGEIAFGPRAVTFLDRVQVLASKVKSAPSPGYVRTLRDALGLTQAEFGKAVGVGAMTVSRWEHGRLRPSESAVAAMERCRRKLSRHGVLVTAGSRRGGAARKRHAKAI